MDFPVSAPENPVGCVAQTPNFENRLDCMSGRRRKNTNPLGKGNEFRHGAGLHLVNRRGVPTPIGALSY